MFVMSNVIMPAFSMLGILLSLCWCRHADVHCAECHYVIMLGIVMLGVIILEVIMAGVILLNVIMLGAIVLNVIMLGVIVLNIIMLGAIGLNVIMLVQLC